MAVDVFEMVVDDYRWFGSCVLSVASVDISADTSADISVDYRLTIGRLSVESRLYIGR